MSAEYSNCLNVWGGGQLLAFSGVDGPTPFHRALVARTAMQGCGIAVKLPGEASLQFSEAVPRRCFVTSDIVDVEHDRGRTRAVFVDACHLLVEGPCDVGACGAELKTLTTGDRTLIGAADGFDAALIDADIEAAIDSRMTMAPGRGEARSVGDGAFRSGRIGRPSRS